MINQTLAPTGRLWRITTSNASATLSGVKYTWDANGNMLQRQDAVTNETENFGYDFLDRLTSVSGAYNQSYTYDKVGNILSMNNVSYAYGAKPHAVTSVGAANYSYDANGNMITRGGQTLTWDLANMPVSVTSGGNTSTFVYDGDGNRVKKIEGGQTTVYVNKYYEKNLTTGNVTTHYYSGGKEVAYRTNNSLRYVHQDSLSSTSVTTDSAGAVVATIKYSPFGVCRNSQGTVDTDKLFTGQRLDQTGLYFYNARYYDATIGRFISPDSIVQSLANPQTLNRYSYCLNNPLKYIDPSGHEDIPDGMEPIYDATGNIIPGAYQGKGGSIPFSKGGGCPEARWLYAMYYMGEAGNGMDGLIRATIFAYSGISSRTGGAGTSGGSGGGSGGAGTGSSTISPGIYGGTQSVTTTLPGTLDTKALADLNVDVQSTQGASGTIGHVCTDEYRRQCFRDSYNSGYDYEDLGKFDADDVDCAQCQCQRNAVDENDQQVHDAVEGAEHSSVDITNSYYWSQGYNYYYEVPIGGQ